MNQKIKNVLGLGLAVLVLLTVLVWMLNSALVGFSGIAFPIVVILLVLGAVYLIWNRVKATKAGLPAEDELSRKAVIKAGYYGFFAAIYGALALMFYNSLAEDSAWFVLDADRMAEAIILISALVFMVSALWMTFKGNAE